MATSPDPVVAVFDRAAQGVVSQFISSYTLHRVTFTSKALSVIGECTEYRSSLEVSTRECQDQALEWGMGGGEVGEREGGREKLLKRCNVLINCAPKTRCVRAKIVLTGYFDRRPPHSYFKP